MVSFFSAEAIDTAVSLFAIRGLQLMEQNPFANATFGHLGMEQTMALKIAIAAIVPGIAALRARHSEALENMWTKALYFSSAAAWGFTSATIITTSLG